MENCLTTFEKIFSEKSEKKLETEAVLPEYLPNISRIVKVSVMPALKTRECRKDSLSLEAKAVFGVVYVSDFKDKLKCAVFPLDFSHSFPARNISEEIADSGFARWNIEISDEKAQMLSPRKLAISCTARISAEASAMRQSEIFSPEDGGNLRKLEKEAEAMSVSELPECEVRIEESITLEEGMPGISEIVFADCSLCTESTEIDGDTCRFSGNALLSCMYLADSDENEAKYISFSKKLPFSASINTGDVAPDSFVLPRSNVTGVNADAMQDSYGESNICSVSIFGNISSKLYSRHTAKVCEDVFCTKHNCECEVKDIPCDTLAGCESGHSYVTENVRANLGNITDIISQTAALSVISTESTEQGPLANIRVNLRITGIGGQGSVESTSAVFNVKVPFGERTGERYEKCRFDTNAELAGIECRIENGEIICSLDIMLSSAVYARGAVRAVTAVEIDDSAEFERDKSEYIIYYPGEDDTIWSSAKKYRVSPDELAAINGLSRNDSLKDKKTLIIPR